MMVAGDLLVKDGDCVVMLVRVRLMVVVMGTRVERESDSRVR